MGSVQFQIVPCFSPRFFSRSIGPFQWLVSANYRILTCCICHFQSASLFFVYFGFVCFQVSSVSNFCPDTGGKGGHLFRLTCSAVLWGGRDTANKYHWCVWGVLTVPGPHWVCPHSWLSQSTLLSLQVALQGNCLKRVLGFVHFPDLSHSGSSSQVLHKGTDSVVPAFCALPRSEQLRRPGAWWAHTTQVGSASYRLPHPSHLVSWVHSRTAISGVLGVSSGELTSGCDPPGRCQPSRIPGRLG